MRNRQLLTLFIFTLSFLALPARAATYTVTNTGDDGAGSLRAAINAANSTLANDTINFNISGCPNGVCTINLMTGVLIVNSAASSGSLNISNSTGADKLDVRGNSAFPDPFGVLEIDGGADLTIAGVTLSNGGVNARNGGGIANGGNLTLKSSIVKDNICYGVSGFGSGGGIYNAPSATLTVTKSSITGNQNTGNFGGGGIWNDGGSVTITDSNISGNTSSSGIGAGGGIFSTGTLTVAGSSISGNSASGGGGGIAGGGILTVTNTKIYGNEAVNSSGGGFAISPGTAIFTNSAVFDNSALYGGGVSVNGVKGNITNLTLNGVIVSANIAGNGGGIFNDGGNVTIRDTLIDSNTYKEDFGFGGGINNNGGLVTLINSIVSRNLSPFLGPGIFNASEMSVINSTITRNVALPNNGSAGIFNISSLTMRNSIVAGNSADYFPDVQNSGEFVSKGNNLIGNSETSGDVSWQTSDILNQTARLAPLGNYGGATQTFALTVGSPAINNGNNCVVTLNGCGDGNPAIATDARGASRVGSVDIGAFELNNAANGGSFRAVTTSGTVNSPFNYLLASDSGAFTYSVTAGSLPPGLSLINSLAPQAGTYSINGTPTFSGTFSCTIAATDGINSVSTDYSTTIAAAPTAADVSVGGKVLTSGSRGVANAQVVLTGERGQAKMTRTNSFGYFSFENIRAGETYVVSIRDKRYGFTPQLVSPNDDVADLIFVSTDEQRISLNKPAR